jgi:hypothetical protein
MIRYALPPPVVPARLAKNLRSVSWSQNFNDYATSQVQHKGSMKGRRIPLNTPWDVAPAVLHDFDTGANFIDGELLTISDGHETVVFEFDVYTSPALPDGVAPGHRAIEIETTMAVGDVVDQIDDAIYHAQQADLLDLNVIRNADVQILLYPRQPRHCMSGDISPLSTTSVNGLKIQGWGIGADQLSAFVRYNAGNWVAIRWGLSRGAALMLPPQDDLGGEARQPPPQ